MSRPTTGRTALAAAVLAVLCTGGVSASTFVEMPTADLARRAETVALGTVTSVTSTWNADRTSIYSHVTVAVEETLAGARAEELVFRVPGGRMDGYVLEMVGAPEFRSGARVVVFTTRWNDGARKVLGYFQGLSEVVAAPDGAETLVGGSAAGTSLDELRRTVVRVRAGGR